MADQKISHAQISANKREEIIAQLERGENLSFLSERYGIPEETIQSWASYTLHPQGNEDHSLNRLREENERLRQLYVEMALRYESLRRELSDPVTNRKKLLEVQRLAREFPLREPTQEELAGVTQNSELPDSRLEAQRRSGSSLDEQYLGDPVELQSPSTLPLADQDREAVPGQWITQLIPLKYLLALGAAALCALFFWGLRPPNQPKATTPLTESSNSDSEIQGRFMEKASSLEISNEARRIVEAYMNADSNQERSHVLIDGESKIPLMKEFFGRPKITPPQGFLEIVNENFFAQEGLPFFVVLAKDQANASHIFNLLPKGESFLIDWESSVGYDEISWESFIDQKPSSPITMRVFISRQLRDISQGEPFFGMSSHTPQQQVFAYADPSAPFSHQLSRILDTAPGNLHPVTVKTRWNHDQECPEIVTLEHRYWIDFKSHTR